MTFAVGILFPMIFFIGAIGIITIILLSTETPRSHKQPPIAATQKKVRPIQTSRKGYSWSLMTQLQRVLHKKNRTVQRPTQSENKIVELDKYRVPTFTPRPSIKPPPPENIPDPDDDPPPNAA
jgi:hypothetical protein